MKMIREDPGEAPLWALHPGRPHSASVRRSINLQTYFSFSMKIAYRRKITEQLSFDQTLKKTNHSEIKHETGKKARGSLEAAFGKGEPV